MAAPPRIFDRSLLRLRLDRAAGTFAGADYLHARAAADLAERLEGINRTFPLALELGARRGAMRQALTRAGGDRVGALVEASLSRGMLGPGRPPRAVLDEERLPLAVRSIDLLLSVLALHWANDLIGVMIQIRRALRPDGLFLASMLGGATLSELRQVLLAAELEVRGGAGPRVAPFADPYDAAQLLQRAGFALPVVDVETVTVRYDDPIRLLFDLRAMGETSVVVERPGPMRRDLLARAMDLYRERFGDADGKVPASFEIITLTGWAPP